MRTTPGTGEDAGRSSCSRRNLLAALFGGPSALPVPAEEPRLLRIAISETLLGEVNINDARAAMVVWMRRIAQELKLELRYNNNVFEAPERLATLLRGGLLDTVAISVAEYRKLADVLDDSQVTVPARKTKLTFVLLVRTEAGFTRLADLKGRRLMALKSPMMNIAPVWLSNQLHAENLPDTGRFFGSIVWDGKPARVMLPVFFGQADACLTTNASFVTMSELNPQTAKRLRPVATSPEVVNSVYAFRKHWDRVSRQEVVRALADLRSNAAGRQILTMFQCDDLESRSPSCLASSLAILDQAERNDRNPGKDVQATRE